MTKEQQAANEGWVYVSGSKIIRGWNAVWVEEAAQHTDTHGSHAWRARKAGDLAAARQSPVVQRLLEADSQVYSAAHFRFNHLCKLHHIVGRRSGSTDQSSMSASVHASTTMHTGPV